MVRSMTIAAWPLIAGVSAIGCVLSQLALNTGTLTVGSWAGTASAEGDGDAVGKADVLAGMTGRAVGRALAVARVDAVLAVAAIACMSRLVVSMP